MIRIDAGDRDILKKISEIPQFFDRLKDLLNKSMERNNNNTRRNAK